MENNISEKKEYPGLDILRLICAVLVVSIHFEPFGPDEAFKMLNYRAVQYFSRIAVPMFFIISSFFFFRKTVKDGRIDMRAALLRCWGYYKQYLIWTLIYLFMIVKSYTHGRKTIPELIRDFFFCGSYLHLWYIPALVTGLLIVSLMLKAGIKKHWIMIISVLLYAVALLGQSYYNVLAPLRESSRSFDDIQSLYFRIFYTTRNGLFEGTIFAAIGYFLSCAHVQEAAEKKKTFTLVLITAVFFILEVIEAELVYGLKLAREADFYITTPFICVCLFKLFAAVPEKSGPPNEGTADRGRFFRDLSTYVYFVQMYAGMAVKDVLNILVPSKKDRHYLFLPTLVCSFALAFVIMFFKRKIASRKAAGQ